MNSFTIPVNTVFTLTWTLTDALGNPINNAVVTATLYAGRSVTNPIATPGTAVAPIINLILPYVLGSAGQYSAAIPGTVNPPIDGTGYVLVINGTINNGATQIYHTEQPAVVDTGVAGTGSALDLTTIEQVKNWIPGLVAAGTTSPALTGNTDDAIIQACITAWGFEFLNRTGLGNQNGDLQQSPFNNVCSFNENYDGAGTRRLFLRNRPIRAVTSLMINGVTVPQSGGQTVAGWVIDGTAKSIALLPGLGGWSGSLPFTAWQSGAYRPFAGGFKFFSGIQNVNVQYTAGYSNTPADIVECANEVVHQNYRRRNWIDEESRAMAGGGGSIRYRSWDIPYRCQLVVDRYTRTL